jgi:hypothetical protein
LEGWNVQESYFVNKWKAEAAKETTLKTRRGDLQRILVSKYQQPMPPELGSLIEQQTDAEKLSVWLDVAVTTTSLEEFQAKVTQEGTGSP